MEYLDSDLLLESDTKKIEQSIIDYIILLKKNLPRLQKQSIPVFPIKGGGNINK